MYKRTKGYILLTLLVLTGLGGHIASETITSKERRFLVDHLKVSKTLLLENIKDLSDKQLNFKPHPDKWSIKEHVHHLVLLEEVLSQLNETSLKQTEAKLERSITDESLLKLMSDPTCKVMPYENLIPKNNKWEKSSEAIQDFKKHRNQTIKFATYTTDNLRNHFATTQVGVLDAYQLLLMLGSHTATHNQKILEIKSIPSFPKKDR